jgi:membrane-associated phospholipid phosphatase
VRCACGFPVRSVAVPVRAAVAAAAAYAALAGLVASGAATGLDQWASSHAMPFAGGIGQPPTVLESLVPLLHADYHPAGAAVTEIVTLPGQVVISFLIVLVAAWRLARRGRSDVALGWIAAWVLAVGIEVLCRHTLVRPALYRGGSHIVGFDSSWPSGHTLRCALVVAALAVAWPRLRWGLGLWFVAAAVLLELAGFHTPTDVLGGLLLATLTVAAVLALEESGLLGRAALRRARTRATA